MLSLLKKKEALLIDALKEFTDTKISSTQTLQVKVNEARKDYENATEKLHALKKKGIEKSGKLIQVERDEVKSKQHLDFMTYSYMSKMKDLLLNAQLSVIKCSFEMLNIKNKIYKDSHSLITKKTKEMNETYGQLMEIYRINEIKKQEELNKHFQNGSTNEDPSSKSVREGYLWCKIGLSGKFKRRWISVFNGQLHIYKNWKITTPKERLDLVLCSVKQIQSDQRLPYAFEVRSYLDQVVQFLCKDESEMNIWMSMIQNIIASQLNSNERDDRKLRKGSLYGDSVYDDVLSVYGNDICADCGKPNPEWVSINHGVTICIDCSGVHRSLGSHISKVKSLKLDSFEPETIMILKSIGNINANSLTLESSLSNTLKLTPNSSRADREYFIRAKYAEKKFITPMSDINSKLEAIFLTDVLKPASLYHIISQPGCDINYKSVQHKQTLLHYCVINQNITCMMLIILMGGNLDIQDINGDTPLHIASKNNYVSCTRILLQHNASLNILNNDNLTPIQCASITNSNDCYSLLTTYDKENLSDDEDGIADKQKETIESINWNKVENKGRIKTPNKKKKSKTLRSGVVTGRDIEELINNYDSLESKHPSQKKDIQIPPPLHVSTDSLVKKTTFVPPPPPPPPIVKMKSKNKKKKKEGQAKIEIPPPIG